MEGSMKRLPILAAIGVATAVIVALNFTPAGSFCGFYAAKADISLLNKSSQVILVRDGDRTHITMLNDFKGDAKDFALIVPVPEVMKRENITTVDRTLFDKIEMYSSPRLAEYYDIHPCYPYSDEDELSDPLNPARNEDYEPPEPTERPGVALGVKVEAQYTVGEYDIVILSAEQSGGLAEWLVQNGYKIPSKAAAVLEPYVKSGLKFFVAKVNLAELPKTGYAYLSPLRITFDSPRFMLPIRLGMANAGGDQDLLLYCFSKRGRVVSRNYRTVTLPTDEDVPLFVKPDFGAFYNRVFDREYDKRGKSVVFVEYAWDVSATKGVKCDPCPSPPVGPGEMALAGVDWYGNDRVFFTRLHVRYNRETFPEDLMLQETPNTSKYQVLFAVHNPASPNFDCEEANDYLEKLHDRREDEVDTYSDLTGYHPENYAYYIREYDKYHK